MIERGTKGAVLVNDTESDVSFETASGLADGTYTDQVSGAAYTVKDGKLTGTIAAGSVIVLYTPEEASGDVIGDLDGDGVVTIQDVTILQRHLAEFRNADGTPIVDETDARQVKIADFDGNGFINISDATAMQRFIAELAPV